MSGSGADNPDNAPLPELQQADLDQARFVTYLNELHVRAKNLHVAVKDGPRERLRPLGTLSEMAALFVSRSAWGAQIRYEVNNTVWLDTLIQSADGVRLVRMAQ